MRSATRLPANARECSQSDPNLSHPVESPGSFREVIVRLAYYWSGG
jgi:hypothetical protein